MPDPAMNAKASASQEPSMEDVLASIRRLLSEDAAGSDQGNVDAAGDDHGKAPGSQTRGGKNHGADAAAAPTGAQSTSPDEDGDDGDLVLSEDEAEDDGLVLSDDGPDAYDDGLDNRGGTYGDIDAPDSQAPEEKEHDVFMLTPKMRAAAETKLLSVAATESSTDVLSQLAKAILDRRDLAIGTRDATLEDMVRSMLRPLLKEWLDRNLPYIIERLVKKELDIMVNRAERLED